MPITISLVYAQSNHLRYFLSTLETDSASGTITTTGAATPDIQTDLIAGGHQGPLLKLAKVVTQGYGSFAAGAQTQAKGRALWLSDRSGANPAANTSIPSIVPTATCRLTARAGTSAAWLVDVIDNAGNPEIQVAAIAVSDGEQAGEAYLDIYVRDTIGG